MAPIPVNGDAPQVIIPVSFEMAEDVIVKNTGPSPIYLLRTPGLYTQGFVLGPGATKVWLAGNALYVQCDPGNTSVIEYTTDAGQFYSPAPQNIPKVLWNARNVPTRDGQCPARFATLDGAGQGPNFFELDTSVPSVQADTGYIDISNYSTVIISGFENQNPITSANREIRRVLVTWYTQVSDGTYAAVTDNYYYHYCLPLTTINPPGVPESNPQFRLVTPARANFVRVRIGAVAMTTPVPNGQITYSLLVIGDNRPITEPWAAYDSGYYYTQEFGTYGNTDMSTAEADYGVFSMPAGNTTVSLSHRSGPNYFSARITTTGALVQGTRVQLSPVGVGASITKAFVWPAGATGIQEIGGVVNLPDRPITMTIGNQQGAAQVFTWALTPERQ